jgi:hypothetical protein
MVEFPPASPKKFLGNFHSLGIPKLDSTEFTPAYFPGNLFILMIYNKKL